MTVSFNKLQDIVSGPDIENILKELGLDSERGLVSEFIFGSLLSVGGIIRARQTNDGSIQSLENLLSNVDVFKDKAILFINETISGGETIKTIPPNILSHKSQMGEKLCSTIMVRKNLNARFKDTNSRDISVFLNMIPQTVASAMVPYFEVEFETMHEPAGTVFGDATPNTPGILRFLLGSEKSLISQNSGDNLMYRGQNASPVTLGDKEYDLSYMGMEMFTSPVTLTNATPNRNGVSVLNPFAPFASIQSYNVTVASAGAGTGLNSVKTAKLELVIHDRSRIGEFSQVLNPELSKSTSVWVTYGWRYGGSKIPGADPYAELINGKMMWKERQRIKSSSYSFDGNAVKVSIDLFTDGEIHLTQKKIKNLLGNVKLDMGSTEIQQKLNVIANAAGLDSENSVIGNDFLSTILRGELPEVKDSKEFAEKISDLQSTLKGQLKGKKIDPKDIDALIKIIKDKYKFEKSNYKKVEEYKNTISGLLANNLTEILSINDDPFMHPSWKGAASSSKFQVSEYNKVGDEVLSKIKKNGIKNIKNYISYGALFNYFVMKSAQEIPGIDEVQAFFGDLNGNTSFVNPDGSDITGEVFNIAQFPIDVREFLNDYKLLVTTRGETTLKISDMMDLLNSQINDVRGVAYGFRKYVLPDEKGGEGTKYAKNMQKEYERLIKERNFETPSVGMKIEVLPVKNSTSNYDDVLEKYRASAKSTRINGKVGNILKITVKDNNYKSNVDSILSSIHSKITPSENNLLSEINKLSSRGVGLKQYEVEGNKKYMVEFSNNRAVKDFIMKYFSTINIGSAGSMITAVSVSTNTDKNDATSRMLRSSIPGQVFGSSESGGTPLRVYPAKVSMTTFGCPLFEYGQSYFIDFNTSTDLDNKYLVTGITHSITQGKFTTSLNFSADDKYGAFRYPRSVENLLSLIKSLVA